MDVISMLRGQLQGAHGVLEGTLGNPTDEQVHQTPPGRTATIAANYAHCVLGEDFLSSLLDGSRPLLMGEWAGRTGISEPPPQGGSWEEWGKRVKVDLPQAREYAQAVYGKTDGIVSQLSADDLDKPLDLTRVGFGMRDVGFLISAVLATHPIMHAGEISAVKGLDGLQGYPF